jgi:hypothetical protein
MKRRVEVSTRTEVRQDVSPIVWCLNSVSLCGSLRALCVSAVEMTFTAETQRARREPQRNISN